MNEHTYKLTGIAPLLLHNGAASDPLSPYAKERSRLNAKKKKTDEDHLALYLIDWFSSIYHNGQTSDVIDRGTVTVDPSARVIIPGEVLEAMISCGAAKLKQRASCSGLFVADAALLEYDGPKDINKLWEEGKHFHKCSVVVSQRRIIRVRPIFRKWSLQLTATVDTSVLNESQLLDILTTAGQIVGLGDWRPGSPRGGKFGRFEVSRV